LLSGQNDESENSSPYRTGLPDTALQKILQAVLRGGKRHLVNQ